jgi:hypothetical protein
MEAIYLNEPVITDKCSDLKFETMLEIPKEETQEIIRKIATVLLSGKRRLSLQECLELL